MTPDRNQLALPDSIFIAGDQELDEHGGIYELSPSPHVLMYEYVRKDKTRAQQMVAITAQTVTDDELKARIEAIGLETYSKDTLFIPVHKQTIDALTRAATAPKNCDALVKAAKMFLTGKFKKSVLVKYFEESLATHRAQDSN